MNFADHLIDICHEEDHPKVPGHLFTNMVTVLVYVFKEAYNFYWFCQSTQLR